MDKGEPMNIDLDFKSQFYNLQGDHVNDRKKNFHKLLHSTSLDIPDEQIDIQPRNYLENIFYVDVLIYFKKVEKLTEILQRGTGLLSSKILKQRWFFEEAFKHMSEEDLVNRFFPTLCYSLRMKVLKKLSLTLNEERMDKIFDLVIERYGLSTAKQFLFSCSSEKIVHILKNNEITLSSEQLKRLTQKDFDLLKLYSEEYKKNMKKEFDDHDFLNYLAWKYPNRYFELGLNHKSFIKLGRNTTRALLKNNKEEVLKDIKNSRLNKAALVRGVMEFDKKYLHLFFPDDIQDVGYRSSYSDLASIISKYPMKKRWEVFSDAFKRAYNEEIVEHLDKFQERSVSKLFPEKIQQKWAEIKYLDSDDLLYIKYYDPNKAFKLLRDKINVTSDIDQRARLLNELINVCYKNKDSSTYGEVLKYICTRHRNEDRHFRSNLMSHIYRNIDYNLITEVHWKYINELIDLQRVREETLHFELIVEYLVFLCKKKLFIDEAVTQYAKDCIKNCRTFRLYGGYRLKEVGAESIVLKHVIKILPTLEHKDEKQLTYELMSAIVNFNKDIKTKKNLKDEFEKYWIDLNECVPIIDLAKEVCRKQEPYEHEDYAVISNLMIYNCLYSEIPLQVVDENILLNIIKTMSENKVNAHTIYDSILDIIRKPARNHFEGTLLDHFFSTIKSEHFYSLSHAVRYFLYHEPQVVQKYFAVILPLVTTTDICLLNYNIIKKYSHLGLDGKVINHFIGLVSVNTKCDKKVKLLDALSRIMSTKDFLDLVQEYIPKDKKLDLTNKDQRELYQIQCDLVGAFKNLDDLLILAPVLMHFCQGDYLQSSLAALYRILYRIKEKEAVSYINIMGERAISARKHAVFLSFKLLSFKDAVAVYSVISNKEKNISAKKYLFDSLLKYFIQNPLGSLLDLVFLNMDFVNKNDNEMIETLVKSADKVSNKYRHLFIEKVWNFLDVLEQQDVKVTSHRNTLLHTINCYTKSFISSLPADFSESIIKRFFLSSDNRLTTISDKIDHFAINFLLAYSDESHFKFVFNIIKSYKDTHWASNNKNTITFIFRFFDIAYEKFDENDVNFLKLFTSFWAEIFSHVESFYQHTRLMLMVLYKVNTNIEAFSKKVDKFLLELTTEYGPYISELLIKSINDFYSNISTEYNTDFTLGNFVFHLLHSNPSELNCFIAFSIIQDFHSPDEKNSYIKVMDVLKSITYFTASVYSTALLKGSLN